MSGLQVMFVVAGEAGGSSMIFVERQAESLRNEGVRVDIFRLRSRTSFIQLVREFRRYRTELRRSKPAVVHAHFGTMTGFFAAVGCGARPLVITYWGSDLNPPGLSAGFRERVRAGLGRLMSQLAALRAARIVCVSRELRGRLWWRRRRVSVLPGGVDTAAFFPEPCGVVRRRLGWPVEERVILFNAGHDPRIKRLDLARAAVAAIGDSIPHLRMEVLDGRIEPDRVPALMNAADCLLVTSDREGSPSVVQEALACDLPVVSVEVGDVPERLAGVRNCSVVARDADALGQAAAEVLRKAERSDGHLKSDGNSTRTVARRLRHLYCELARSTAVKAWGWPWNTSRCSP